MTEWGRDDLRRFVSHILDTYIQALERQHDGGPVTVKDLRDVARAFESSTTLDTSISATYRRIKDEAAKELIRNRRREPFKRLMVHPLTSSLDSGALPRDMLPNYFNFLHLVLGDETEALSRLCVTICKDERHEDGVDWDAFYRDDRAKYVLWDGVASHRRQFQTLRYTARLVHCPDAEQADRNELGQQCFRPAATRE